MPAESPQPRPVNTRAVLEARFDGLVKKFFDNAYFPFNPTQGTAAGLHKYDTELEDYSAARIAREVEVLRQQWKKFSAFKPPVFVVRGVDASKATGKPTPGGVLARKESNSVIDRALVLSYIEARLLELEKIRMWEKDPDQYASGLANSAFLIMARDYAPQEERLRALIERERKMPGMLAQGKKNLKDPPRVYTEVAIDQVAGIAGFFRSDVPKTFDKVKDEKLLTEFAKVNGEVVSALREYGTWLKQDLLPRSHGDFRIGAQRFQEKLAAEEMVDIPLDRLLEIGLADLHRNQQAFKEAAAKLDPNKSPERILAEITADHPRPDHLLQSVRDVLSGLKDFIEQHKIVTIPSEVPPIVQETPPFARALTSASMDTPGPFEKVAKEAYYNVTLPDPSLSPKETEDYMGGFNYGVITSTSVHEAYPGHYSQFLWTPFAATKTRKLLGANSNSEGWAHYTEQMMLDEGYGVPPGGSKDSPEFLRLRLGQLLDALLRNARFVVGLKMHTGQMTFDEGVDFFVKEGHQTRSTAFKETRRGTSDPTYLYYTLGKLQILKLRDDYRKKMGPAFSLQQFHDRFLGFGFPPVQLIRRELMGDDSPTL
ncbi:MAG: DUF885 domain-containing protein [Acidobacteriales bacterium]|nr:DUF885 domain-containing protein [Terriglobales bacterium]